MERGRLRMHQDATRSLDEDPTPASHHSLKHLASGQASPPVKRIGDCPATRLPASLRSIAADPERSASQNVKTFNLAKKNARDLMANQIASDDVAVNHDWKERNFLARNRKHDLREFMASIEIEILRRLAIVAYLPSTDAAPWRTVRHSIPRRARVPEFLVTKISTP